MIIMDSPTARANTIMDFNETYDNIINTDPTLKFFNEQNLSGSNVIHQSAIKLSVVKSAIFKTVSKIVEYQKKI